MKKFILLALMASPLPVLAQFGIKAGPNFANVTKASSINNSSKTGFHAGVLFGSSSEKLFGARTELLYSKQGYDYKTSTNTGDVNLDYLVSTNLTCLNITKYIQVQAGFQMAYLLNAKVDSNKVSTGNVQADKIMDLLNRFDYGFAGGVEVHPVAGLLVGARANISLGKLYKDAQSGQMPTFSSVDLKNNVFQLFLGWRFGQMSSKKK